jgi:hypothetical protein
MGESNKSLLSKLVRIKLILRKLQTPKPQFEIPTQYKTVEEKPILWVKIFTP